MTIKDTKREVESQDQLDKTVGDTPDEAATQHPDTNIILPTEVPQQSTHVRARPKHLDNFIIDLPPSVNLSKTIDDSSTSKPCPISQYVNYNKFSKSHLAYLAATTSTTKPKLLPSI